jgi:hypothetical protein
MALAELSGFQRAMAATLRTALMRRNESPLPVPDAPMDLHVTVREPDRASSGK